VSGQISEPIQVAELLGPTAFQLTGKRALAAEWGQHSITGKAMAGLAVFLAGPGAGFITGQVIAADGGANCTKVWPFQPVEG
jgi:NAD(P)-dependent dehydrogenase (short-subunit alcohol dehydrogenase family)